VNYSVLTLNTALANNRVIILSKFDVIMTGQRSTKQHANPMTHKTISSTTANIPDILQHFKYTISEYKLFYALAMLINDKSYIKL